MTVSERVHLGEIVVMPTSVADQWFAAVSHLNRLPVYRRRRYKPATSISASGDQIMAIQRTFSIIKPDATRAQSDRRHQCADREGRASHRCPEAYSH